MSGLRLIRRGESHRETPSGHWDMHAHLLVDHDAVRVQYCEMEAGGGAEPHLHDDADQILVVVEGSLNVGANDDDPRMTVGEGDAVYVPAGAPHATKPADDRRVTYVVVTFPTP